MCLNCFKGETIHYNNISRGKVGGLHMRKIWKIQFHLLFLIARCLNESIRETWEIWATRLWRKRGKLDKYFLHRLYSLLLLYNICNLYTVVGLPVSSDESETTVVWRIFIALSNAAFLLPSFFLKKCASLRSVQQVFIRLKSKTLTQ